MVQNKLEINDKSLPLMAKLARLYDLKHWLSDTTSILATKDQEVFSDLINQVISDYEQKVKL